MTSFRQQDVRVFNKNRLLKILFILMGIGILFYMLEFTSLKLPVTSDLYTQFLKHYNNPHHQQDEQDDTNEAYFVNTPGCKMPSFPVIDENILRYLEEPSKIICKKSMTSADADHIWISMNITELQFFYNISDVKMLSCFYQPFHRKSDTTNIFKKKTVFFKFSERIKVSSEDEFIKVTCNYLNVGDVYTDFHYFVPEKRNKNKKPSIVDNNSAGGDKVSVAVIGLDSVSRLNLVRQMKSTLNVLNKLKALEMEGYNKVGDNTYPNLVPVLSGLETSELEASCLPDKNSTYDKCYFIWNEYSNYNYLTAFAEDIGFLGLFNYFRKGFSKQPTDYYSRPIVTAMERNIAYNWYGNVYLCYGGRTPLHILLDYAHKFLIGTALRNSPGFGFFWTSSFSHDYFNMPKLIDEEFAVYFLKLANLNVLNNTVLFFMSDHGIRWGPFRNTYQGMIEERQPFLYAIFPDWFYSRYPLAMKNFRQNKRKLTTHFDFHETLKDLVKLSQLESYEIQTRSKELCETEPIPRGISLFLPIPPSRTCEHAGIGPHWCTCHEKRPIATIDPKVFKTARYLVNKINAMLVKFPQCHTLHLNTIKEANIGTANDKILNGNFGNHLSDITIRFQTKPGFAEFEATVRISSDDNINLTGTISRTNLYGAQSNCVDDYKIKLYCFCGR